MIGQRVTEDFGEAVGRDYEGASALNDAVDFADQMLNSLNGTVVP
jgi:hypothetical protein